MPPNWQHQFIQFLTDLSSMFFNGLTCLSESFSSFLLCRLIRLLTLHLACRFRKNITEGHHFSSVPLFTTSLASARLPDALVLSALALAYLRSLESQLKAVRRLIRKKPLSGQRNLKKSGVMSLSRHFLRNSILRKLLIKLLKCLNNLIQVSK